MSFPFQKRSDETGTEPVEHEHVWEKFVPPALESTDDIRRARLMIRFGFLGTVFGLVYAGFYFAIGYSSAAWIIVVCSLSFLSMPFALRHFGRLDSVGHFFAFTLWLGFGALCAVEGGIHGHAVAWLASIPLCVLMLVSTRSALVWSAICFASVFTLGIYPMLGVVVPNIYSPERQNLISLAGYAGLVPFMTLLGVIFERTRKRAFDGMRAAHEELKASNERLVEVNMDKSEFLSIAAHDLKNPLSAIKGLADLVAQESNSLQSPTLEHAGQISATADRMLSIISKLLDIRAIEDGEMKFEPARCGVNSLLDRVELDYAPSAEAKDQRLDIIRSRDLGLSARADAGALRNILDNLVSNAVKYTPKGGAILISVREGLNAITIDIKDNGPGLSEEDQQKLFGRFTKLTPRPTGGESSNGLGLYIVRRMSRALGGDVECESSEGTGSIFSLQLPRWDGAADAPDALETSSSNPRINLSIPPSRANLDGRRPSASAEESSEPHPLSILLVDDEPLVASIVSQLLVHDGHEVDTAGDAGSALEQIEGQSYDLIISDRSMPGQSGDWLAAQCKIILPESPFIMMTGDSEVVVRGGIHGVDGYLGKPIDATAIRELLEDLSSREPEAEESDFLGY